MEKEQGIYLSSVKNTMKILRSFKMEKPQRGVRELAEELGMGKSSVQRILTTLASEGFVKKNEGTNKYELGISVLELSSIVLGQIDLHTEALPIIKQLADKCNETAHLAVLDNDQVVYLSKIESRSSIKLPSYSGLHNYVHCTSSGKLLLAFGDQAKVEEIIEKGLPKFTSNTITDPARFRIELVSIKKNRYSVSHGEFTVGVTSVSAPIRDHSGKVIAAINLVGPSSRINKPRIHYFAEELIHSGELISEKLGYWKR